MRSAAVVCCVVAMMSSGISPGVSADHGAAEHTGADSVVTDARPFINPSQAISIRDVIDAYSISGARFLGRESEAGSIEVGKSADFMVLDRDILKLADDGHADDICNTSVLQTWFMGKSVYVSNGRNNSAKRGLTK